MLKKPSICVFIFRLTYLTSLRLRKPNFTVLEAEQFTGMDGMFQMNLDCWLRVI